LGSFISIRGSGFPAGASVLILINDFAQTPLVVCDGSGNFLLVLDMSLAGEGIYCVTAMVAPASFGESYAPRVASSVTFSILPSAPIRTREGGTGSAPTFTIASGLALPLQKTFLPLIIR
jgi:hypothetical protein